MAQVIDRTWRSGPRKVKRHAWGYTLMIEGRQERKYNAAWSEDDARSALVARQAELAALPAPAPTERTLQQLAEEYFAYKERRGKRSLMEDARIITTRLLPAFSGERPVRQLTAAEIAQYERRRLAEVSVYTIALELAVLRHMLRLGRRWGYLDDVPEIEMPRRPEGRQRYLDEAEIERLLAACRTSRNADLAAIVILAINTGMRRGEILGLTWERIDLATSRLTLYDTKNARPRGVPINRATYDALIGLQPDRERRHGRLFSARKIRTAFEGAVERAELKNLRFHDLRHTAASHMVMRGASLKEVQEILGHRTFAMTLRYSHLSPSHLLSAVNRLEGLTKAPASAHESAQTAVESVERAVSP